MGWLVIVARRFQPRSLRCTYKKDPKRIGAFVMRAPRQPGNQSRPSLPSPRSLSRIPCITTYARHVHSSACPTVLCHSHAVSHGTCSVLITANVFVAGRLGCIRRGGRAHRPPAQDSTYSEWYSAHSRIGKPARKGVGRKPGLWDQGFRVSWDDELHTFLGLARSATRSK